MYLNFKIEGEKMLLDPLKTKRASAWKIYKDYPVQTVLILKKVDITNLVKLSKKYKLNMLLCYCLGKSANEIEEFHYRLSENKFYKFDNMCVNMVIKGKDNSIYLCDVPFNDNFNKFCENYKDYVGESHEQNKNISLKDCASISTSNLSSYSFDACLNPSCQAFNVPLFIWSKYYTKKFRKFINISFQFNHIQMDGEHVITFFKNLEYNIKHIKSLIK